MPVGRHVVGQRLVEIELAEVDVGHLAEMGEALQHVILAALGARVLALQRFGHRLADDRVDEEQHLAVVGLAAGRHHVLAHVVAIAAHRLDALDVDDDGIGMGGGELAAARRTAGLGDDGLALRAGA